MKHSTSSHKLYSPCIFCNMDLYPDPILPFIAYFWISMDFSRVWTCLWRVSLVTLGLTSLWSWILATISGAGSNDNPAQCPGCPEAFIGVWYQKISPHKCNYFGGCFQLVFSCVRGGGVNSQSICAASNGCCLVLSTLHASLFPPVVGWTRIYLFTSHTECRWIVSWFLASSFRHT